MPVSGSFKMWDRGPNVQELQKYLGVKADSIYGPITQAAHNAYLAGKNTGSSSVSTASTAPSKPAKPPQYPTTPRPLNAEELGALAARRSAVDTGYKEAIASQERGEGSARLAAAASRQMLDTSFKRTVNDFMSTMAGRGLARSPMFAGKGQKQLQQDREQQMGEIQSGLTSQLDALSEMVNRARIERDMELARISQDEAQMRSNPFDYLMLASQYLGG